MSSGLDGARTIFSIPSFSLPGFLSFLSTHPTHAQRLRALEQAMRDGLPPEPESWASLAARLSSAGRAMQQGAGRAMRRAWWM